MSTGVINFVKICSNCIYYRDGYFQEKYTGKWCQRYVVWERVTNGHWCGEYKTIGECGWTEV